MIADTSRITQSLISNSCENTEFARGFDRGVRMTKQSLSPVSLKGLPRCVLKFAILFLVTINLLFFHSSAFCQESISGEQDIAELMKIAAENFDMDNQDAVILFDGNRAHWTDKNRMTHFVHRITWINSSVGIRHYADIPVAYDSEHQSFRSIALRTWRDDQWWETDTAGIVETLPSAVRTAYDYASLREMMMLHIAIELPCILEEAYIVQDTVSFRKGIEGTYIFPQQDPVIQSWFLLGLPPEKKPNVKFSEGVVERDSEFEEFWGLDIHKYEMDLIPALPVPATKDANFYSPHISWSSWDKWTDFGYDLNRKFEYGAILDSSLIDSVDEIVSHSFTSSDRAQKIAEFVKRSTRLIHIDETNWYWMPRTATETYNSGYGNHFDRSIFAAALFKRAGYMVFPAFRSKEFGDVNEGVPTLNRFEPISVWISEMNGVEAYYNSATSRVHNGLAPIYGRTIWLPASGDDPKVNWSGEGAQSEMEVKLNLSFDNDTSKWKGKGFYRVTSGFNSFDKLEGLDSEAHDHLNEVLKGVFADAKISEYNFAVFNRFLIIAGFDFELPIEKDDQGRIVFDIGSPSSGIMDRLPTDVKLTTNTRQSPIMLRGMMKENFQINLSLTKHETVYTPESLEIDNKVGKMIVSSIVDEDELTIVKELSLTQTTIAGEDWKLLGELLLKYTSKRNTTLMIREIKE